MFGIVKTFHCSVGKSQNQPLTIKSKFFVSIEMALGFLTLGTAVGILLATQGKGGPFSPLKAVTPLGGSLLLGAASFVIVVDGATLLILKCTKRKKGVLTNEGSSGNIGSDRIRRSLEQLGWTKKSKIFSTTPTFQKGNISFTLREFIDATVTNYQVYTIGHGGVIYSQHSKFGFSGIYKDQIFCRSPEDVQAILDLLDEYGLTDEKAALEARLEQLRTLKETYAKTFLLPHPLLDKLGILSTALLAPKAFRDYRRGDEDDIAEMFARSYAIQDVAQFINYFKEQPQFSKSKSRVNNGLEGTAQAALNHNISKRDFSDLFTYFDDPPCINDIMPKDMLSIFPPGIHLVTSESDKRTEEQRADDLIFLTFEDKTAENVQDLLSDANERRGRVSKG